MKGVVSEKSTPVYLSGSAIGAGTDRLSAQPPPTAMQPAGDTSAAADKRSASVRFIESSPFPDSVGAILNPTGLRLRCPGPPKTGPCYAIRAGGVKGRHRGHRAHRGGRDQVFSVSSVISVAEVAV